MKKGLKIFSAAIALSVMMSLLTACPNDTKTSQNDDRTDLTTRQTETGLMPDMSEPNQTINSMEPAESPESEETSEPEETSDSEETTSSGETTSSASAKPTAKPTAKPLGKVKVTDAYKKTHKTIYYGKVTARVPKVTIEGVSTAKVNKEIYDKLQPLVKKYKCKCEYQYHIGKTYVSIFIKYMSDTEWTWDDTECYVYNISRKTGKKMSRAEMLKALGIKASKFESRAKKKISKSKFAESKYYKSAISKKKIKKAVPYVNSKGKLCYLLKSVRVSIDKNYYDFYGTC